MGSVEYLCSVMDKLSRLQKQGQLCDLKLLCSDGCVKAHSAVLASAHVSLKRLITSTGLVLPLHQYTAEMVQRFVSYIYTGKIHCQTKTELENFVCLANDILQTNLQLPEVHDKAESTGSLLNAVCFLALRLREGNSDFAESNLTSTKDKCHQPEIARTEDPEKATKEEVNTTEQKLDVAKEKIRPRKKSNVKRLKRSAVATKRSRRLASKQQKNETEKTVTEPEEHEEKMEPGEEASDAADEEHISDCEDETQTSLTAEDSSPWAKKGCGEKRGAETQAPYLCVMCGHRAHGMRHHLNHLHSKHKVPYKAEDLGRWVDVCPYEGCSYAAPLNMKSHILNVHEATAGIFTCETCVKTFRKQTSLRTHVRRYHMKAVTPEACPLCGKIFASTYLQKHLSNVHNPDNYHLCSHCHFKARTLTNARFHMITKHNDFSLGKVTIHKCKYCEYQCTHINNINRHMKTIHEIKMGLKNKDVLCDICGKPFADQKSMAAHRLWHTNKDRYKCEYCAYTAPFKNSVRLHSLKQHTQKDLRPWRCNHCVYASNDRGNLKKHLLNTHKLPEPEVVEIMKASLTPVQEHTAV